MSYPTIVLNLAEQKLAKYLANVRYRNARLTNTEDRKHSHESNETVDIRGIGGELAFCKLFGVYPLLVMAMDLVSGQTDCGDVKMYGYWIDVKTTYCEHGHLVCEQNKEPGYTDLFALMVGELPRYSFRGFMWANELMQERRLGRLKDDGNLSYLAKQHELTMQFPSYAKGAA